MKRGSAECLRGKGRDWGMSKRTGEPKVGEIQRHANRSVEEHKMGELIKSKGGFSGYSSWEQRDRGDARSV